MRKDIKSENFEQHKNKNDSKTLKSSNLPFSNKINEKYWKKCTKSNFFFSILKNCWVK